MNNSRKVRSLLIKEIEADIVGPRGGPEEILDSRENPAKSYLSGVLFSKQTPMDKEDDERNYTSVDDEDDSSPEEHYDLNIGLKPSSFGLTCTISSDTREIIATINYGVYTAIKKKKDTDYGTFQRVPYSETFVILLDDEISKTESLKANSNFLLKYSIKKYENNYILSIFVVNNHVHITRKTNKTEEYIFQPKITLTTKNQNDLGFIATGHLDLISENQYDSMLFELLFNEKKNFAIGHGCAVEWDEKSITSDSISRLETTFIPKYTIPKIEPRDSDLPGLHMENLFNVSDPSEYRKLLFPIADEYENWINSELESKLDLLPAQFQQTAKKQISECKIALDRIKNGIELISTDKTTEKAFSFANRAMLLQQSYSDWAKKNQKTGKAQGTEPEKYFGKWRLFQLAFFLLNIESISKPTSKDRKIADLLWFATGGGKTEAYLGIIAFTLAHRRLRNASLDYRRYGTAVLMRYTLRLLTLQQFHRAATLMCACEFIRRRNINEWGDEPFLVGLWVGINTTPNNNEDAAEAIQKARSGSIPTKNNPIQIITCPWCGTNIDAYSYKISGKIKQCRIFCPNSYCEFSKKGEDTNIPVLVVDEDIYKRCPSLIIGTVDKFAQISWKWETGSIFGKVNKYCEKHGFVQAELATNCSKHSNFKSFLFDSAGPPRLEPPELIIQDELHLISGPLGTMTGLYETAIDILCTNDDGIGPKIISSTATTKRASEQIHALFNRNESRVFPPQGFIFGESFFAKVNLDENFDKTHLGICAPASSGLTTLSRLSAVIYRIIRSLEENMKTNSFSYEDLDAYYTLVTYFNRIKELGGANKMFDDAVPRLVQRIYNFEEKNSKLKKNKAYKDNQLTKLELTSRTDSSKIPEILHNLSRKLNGDVQPIDLLLCTNMLSVGVDISRLGIMIINGQPKNHSEYIQASGRIGRTSPGLIISVYNYLKPRDLSHYENFYYYHSTLHKNVEPVSLTPFASRARDKGLFGIFVALVRLLEKRLAENNNASKFDKSKDYVSKVCSKISDNIMSRVGNINSSEKDATFNDLNYLIDEWNDWVTEKSYDIIYKRNSHENAKIKQNTYYLLGSVESGFEGLKTVPISLRDAEQSIKLRYLPDKLSRRGNK